MLEWAYSGVDFELYGNGGIECRNYLPPFQLVLETIFIVIYASTCEIYYPWYRSVCNYKPNLEFRERFGRKLLLAGLCIIWGIEIGFKLSTRQFIFILNPCHIVTFIQVNIFFLALKSHLLRKRYNLNLTFKTKDACFFYYYFILIFVMKSQHYANCKWGT